MKHNVKITLIILGMFIITQFIGLYVLSEDPFNIEKEVNGTMQMVPNPALSWISPPEAQTQSDFSVFFGSIVFSFIVAISLLFFLTHFKAEFILKAWFFVVVIIALFISFVAILPTMQYATIIALVLALPLAFIKIYKRDFLVHNITELFVYPGIAAVFVPILNLWTIIALLIIISIYDMWAVWHSGIMQKMARYQIDKLNIFSGFFIPYVSKKVKMQIQKMKKFNPKKLKTKKIKVNVAILGGGDVIFPIITAGVMLQFSLVHALFVTVGATAGLTYLLIFSEKKKFYPAMPFISAGIFIGMILSWFVL